MKKIKWKILIITIIATLAPIILGILFYNKLPDMMPVHFDINNEPNNYASKNFALFGIPAIMVCLQIFLCVSSDINSKQSGSSPKFETMAKLIIPMVSIVIYTSMLIFALGNEVEIRKIAMFIIGIIMVLSGNYIPKISSEMNVRIHPRVLIENEKLWNKSKKIMGYTFFIMGLICIITIFFDAIYSVIAVVALIVVTFVETGYMLYLARKESRKK